VFEADFRLVLEQHLDVLSASERVESLLGYEPSALLSGVPSLKRVIHGSDLVSVRRLFYLTITASSGELSVRMRHASGRIHCTQWRYEREVTAKGETILSVRLAEPAARDSRATGESPTIDLMAVMDSVNECIYLKERNHAITVANRNFRKRFSDPSGGLRDLTGLTDYDLFPEEFADQSYAVEEQILAGEPLGHLVQESTNGQEDTEWVDYRKFPVRDKEGQIVAIFTIGAITTERVLAERALRASEESLREAQKIAGVGSFVLDVESQTWTAWDVLFEVLGLDKGCERTIAVWHLLIHADDVAMLSKFLGELKLHAGKMLDGEPRFIRQTDKRLRWTILERAIPPCRT
jgi:PAS domain-containing protein